jgi:hypothetical protein
VFAQGEQEVRRYRRTIMNTNQQPRDERKQSPAKDEQKRRDEEQFWANWWREYAQTWK